MWGFELFHAGNVVLDTRNKEAYLFGDRNYWILHPFLIKIGQTSPLNLMAIFLERVNLVLDRSLNGMIRIAVDPVE